MINKQIAYITAASVILLSFAFFVLDMNIETNALGQTTHVQVMSNHTNDPNCQSCHIDQWQDWQASHHQKSMAVANADNVLGDFDNVEVSINQQHNHFFKRGDGYWVNTEGQDYKIDYVFGVEPLQQYLIKTQDGKYQTLPLSWDSRPKERGGQRWFHIYGDDHISENDRLHWKQPLQNWNGMCADCHSTGLKRNFDPETNVFDTSFTNINVNCASCHGADNNLLGSTTPSNSGWQILDGVKTAQWVGEKRAGNEIEVCAACHSRRSPLTDGFSPADKFLDAFLPTPILTPEYFPDGQIRDEDYVWGSFMQSKMFKNGVICSDCHNPHSLELKVSGNEMCTTCHQPQYFDTTEHHKHEPASEGAQCVNCHMPARTYMGVDDRRDHSFRIPRPDLNHATNSPDACTTCHADQQPDWAANHISTWFGSNRPSHYGETLNAVFTRARDAEYKLNQLIDDNETPEIIRGSALELLANYPNANSLKAISHGLKQDNPLLRLGAVKASGSISPDIRIGLLIPLLNDEFRAVRVETVRALSDISVNSFQGQNAESYDIARKEFINAQKQTSWRGEGPFNLALFYTAQNDPDKALHYYNQAIEIDPYFPASYVNLADFHRANNDEGQVITTLEKGLILLPENADLNFSKALYLIRLKNNQEALLYLEKAVKYAPNNERYAYVYSVAKQQLGIIN